MRYPIGKGYFIWQKERCGGGDPNKIAQMAKDAGLSWVTIKTHNGISPRNGDLTLLTRALEKVDVKCWGWGYCYGTDPVGEAKIAADSVYLYELAGYFIDAEKEYKAAGMKPRAKTFINELAPRMHVMNKPIGLCAYRFPSLHQTFPWDEFLDGCEFHAPQVYWLEANASDAPARQLIQSCKELKARRDIPIIPIGVASPNDAGTWYPTVVQVDNFDAGVKTQGLPGVGWWSWQHAERSPEIWQAIAKHDWGGKTPEPEPIEIDLSAEISSINIATSEIRSKI